MQTVEIYKIEKIMEAVPAGREYIDVHIFDKNTHDAFRPVDVEENFAEEMVEVKHLPITRLTNRNGINETNRYIAYDPSLEKELGYPITVMTDLLNTQNELSEILRKYELERLKNEQMRQWYEEHIKNAPLTTRLKWVFTGIKD